MRVVLARIAVRVDDEVVKLSIRAGALRIRVAHQADDRADRARRPCAAVPCPARARATTRRECRRDCAVRCRAPSAARRAARSRMISFGVQLARRATADEHRLQPEVVPQRVDDLGPALGQPVLLRLAGRDDDRRERSVELREEVALPRAFVRPRARDPTTTGSCGTSSAVRNSKY